MDRRKDTAVEAVMREFGIKRLPSSQSLPRT